MSTIEILENLQIMMSYFRLHQKEYDAIDQSYRKEVSRLMQESRLKVYVPRLCLLIYGAIFILCYPILFPFLNRLLASCGRSPILPLRDTMYHIVSDSETFFRSLLYPAAAAGVIFLLLLAVVYLLTKQYSKWRTSSFQRKIAPFITTLYRYYEEYPKATGRICLMNSFQFCNPADLAKIFQLLEAGMAQTIPEAVRFLKAKNALSYCVDIPFYNKPYTAGQANSRRAEQTHSQRDASSAKEHAENADSNMSASGVSSPWFKGIDNLEDLKVRYRNLMKTFHSDSTAGDEDNAREINLEYEKLKKKFSSH